MSREAARAEIHSLAGAQFCPASAAALLEIVGSPDAASVAAWTEPAGGKPARE